MRGTSIDQGRRGERPPRRGRTRGRRMTSDLSQLGFLLFVSALVAMLTRRLRLPYTVGLVLAGMGLYFLRIYIKWHLSKDLIFSVFLPPLVFEAALFINWREFKKTCPWLRCWRQWAYCWRQPSRPSACITR